MADKSLESEVRRIPNESRISYRFLPAIQLDFCLERGLPVAYIVSALLEICG
jgi:hypothetical protein